MRILLTWLLLACSLASQAQLPSAAPDLLPVEEAFRFTLLPRGPVLRVRADIADGYFLYRDRIRVEPAQAGLELGTPLMPAGQPKDDPLFGAVEIYRGQVSFDLPVTAIPGDTDAVAVSLTSQGCADLGVCYPPDTRTLRVATAASATRSSGPTQGLDALSRLSAAFSGAAGPGSEGSSGETDFLPVDDAFEVRALADGDGAVTVSFDIAEGYYLYRHRMGFEVTSPVAVRAQTPALPPGKPKSDPYFGEQQVYYRGVEIRIPITGEVGAGPVEMRVSYQGCADAGLCYPPQERMVAIALDGGAASVRPQQAAPSRAAALSETDALARSLMRDALGWVLLSFFAAGLLLSFTPCVLPMIPILSAIIAGQKGEPSMGRGLSLSAVYVLAMSFAYTVAGVVAGLFGQNLQALFQHPAVLIAFSGVFVALALAMFGLYELQLPVVLQSRLAALSHGQRGGSHLGVAVMGVLSALIVGPCVAAPLAAALIVIGSTGDPVRGGMALFALSLGMGVPLLAVGAFGPRLLPKAGAWMVLVKHVFGILLLAVAVYLLGRLLPDPVTLALWSVLALFAAVLLLRVGAGRNVQPAHPYLRRLRMASGVAAMLYGFALAVGAASGGGDPLRPLARLGEPHRAPLAFERVKTVADLDRIIADAGRAGRPVMLDFYADWCVSCKEMERDTFADPAVQAALRDAVLVQADVTAYDEDDKALLARFGLHGPPAILFFGRDGRERREFRVIGYMAAEAFQPHVTRASQS